MLRVLRVREGHVAQHHLALAPGQGAPELLGADARGAFERSLALLERGLMYDWCICNGEYSLREYAGKLMPMFLQNIRAE